MSLPHPILMTRPSLGTNQLEASNGQNLWGSNWTARRSNQSILKEISPGCSLEGLMLKLKLQYFGHLMQRVDSLEKTLIMGGIGGRRRRGQQRMRWLDGITDSMDMSLSIGSWWWTGRPGVLWFMGSQSRTWLSDWTALNWGGRGEKEMAIHSTILAWRILWTEVSGGLLSMGSHWVRHDWSDLAAAAAGGGGGHRSLACYSP